MKKLMILLISLIFATSFVFAVPMRGEVNVSNNVNAGLQGEDSLGNKSNLSKEGNRVEIEARVENNRMVTREFVGQDGQRVQIRERADNGMSIMAGNVSARTTMNMFEEQGQNGTKFSAQLSNGRMAQVKVMPDKASEVAIERLRLNMCSQENNCSIELREVGEGNETRTAYEVKARKEARVFGLFKTNMSVNAQVDAQSGEVIRSNKPWWAFLASE
jgi:hypothetical protein